MTLATVAAIPAAIQFPRYFSKVVNFQFVTAGCLNSAWQTGGEPLVGLYDTTLNGVALSSTSAEVQGQIPFTDPASGNCYLSRFTASCTDGTNYQYRGLATLCDRLWHNGNIDETSTAPQAITSPTWPARDRNGSTNGDGVFIGLEISAAMGAGTPTITVGYTNSAGTAGRTGTNITAASGSSAARRFYPIGLQAGDVGVRSVESITLSATWTSGVCNLVAYRPIASIPLSRETRTGRIDALTAGFPKLYAGSVPFLMVSSGINGTGALNLSGVVEFAHG